MYSLLTNMGGMTGIFLSEKKDFKIDQYALGRGGALEFNVGVLNKAYQWQLVGLGGTLGGKIISD